LHHGLMGPRLDEKGPPPERDSTGYDLSASETKLNSEEQAPALTVMKLKQGLRELKEVIVAKKSLLFNSVGLYTH
jgi:hypothetical protein